MSDSLDIQRACELLRQGELVAFPTETVYGLGADAANPEAIAKIYALKGRPSNHPVIVHLANVEQIENWAANIPATAWQLAAQFWPGPLTLILPRASHVPLAVTGGQESVGLRVPSHPVARRLLEAFRGGIAAPSANRYGRISPTLAAHVLQEFGDRSPLTLDGGDCEVGLESTIVSLVGKPTLLRPGGISRAQIEAVIGPLTEVNPIDAPRAPGTTVSHYAPTTPLRLVETTALGAACSPEAAVLSRQARPDSHRGLWITASSDPVRYGHDLYADLRRLDEAGAPLILVEAPPTDSAWEAVWDRLRRSAAAYTGPELA